jgi:acyl transferase domain-containing protein/NADPH:quinone reductase-like Zn-dependent oxidoreductase/acyl carrier protein
MLTTAHVRGETDDEPEDRAEPIAIVGAGLRFPGGNDNLDSFAEFLRAGRLGIGSPPEGRRGAGWRAHGAQAGTFTGGFVDHIEEFDPEFFNIPPKQAAYIDPQQRMLLLTAWEALENAGIDPNVLRHGNGGIYVGAGALDFTLSLASATPAELDGSLATGIGGYSLSGRLSYFLGWRGPSVTVDTACASSLTALHLAVTGLRQHETSIALAGAVNAMHHSLPFAILSMGQMLASDGRCKAFGDGADGYVRAEGSGMLVLKRLSDAVRDGDTILALIRGTAIGQDGESAGITAPNGVAQEGVIRAALANAGLRPGDIQYVEAHGTGTPLGDPIEMGTINSVFGGSHDEHDRMIVGSVKSNIGHMETAAGVGAVIKVILQMRDGVFFPHLLETPSGQIPWDSYPVTVPTRCTPWQAPVRRAVVNGFGLAGAIGIAVLEQAPKQAAEQERRPGTSQVFTLSAKSAPALALQVARYRDYLSEHQETPLADLCYTRNVGRAHFRHRAAGVVSSNEQLTALLDKLSAKGTVEGSGTYRKVALLFPGSGAQYVGMGSDLYQSFPAFRATVDECAALFEPHLGRSISDVMFGTADDAAQVLAQTTFTHAALFTMEYALARLWISWGIRPGVLLGHSVGEIVAATVAGLFSLPDGVGFLATRARLIQSVSEPGGMAAVGADEADVLPLIAGWPDLAIAAVNGPGQCVISGGAASIEAAARELRSGGIQVTALRVTSAFHSPLMAGISAELKEALVGVRFREPDFTLVSNVTGTIGKPTEMGVPDYWVRHASETVRFADGVQTIGNRGKHVFVEVGPATLTSLGRKCLPDGGHRWVHCLNRADRAGTLIHQALAEMYTAGLNISWPQVYQGSPGRRLPLPPYAFDKRSYWRDEPEQVLTTAPGGTATGAGVLAGLAAAHHPMLGAAVDLADSDGTLLTGRISLSTHPWLADHAIGGTVIVPGTALVELASHAAACTGGGAVDELTLRAPLTLNAEGSSRLQVCVGPTGSGGHRTIAIYGRPEPAAEGAWTCHAAGTLGPASQEQPAPPPETWPPAGAAPLDAAGTYPALAARGYAYGPAFRGLRSAWESDGEVYADIRLPGDVDAGGFAIHPALLDAALHSLALSQLASGASGQVMLPFSWTDVTISGDGSPRSLRVRLTTQGAAKLSLAAFDEAGRLVVTVGSLAMRAISPGALAAGTSADSLFRLTWASLPAPEVTRLGACAVLATDGGRLAGLLAEDPDVTAYPGLEALGAAVANGIPVPATVLLPLPEASGTGAPVGAPVGTPAAVRTAAGDLLADLQGFLGRDEFGAARIVVVTRGAVATGPGEPIALGQAPVWGLARSAQAENPGRVVLVDLDGHEDSARAIVGALAIAEPHVAIRRGALYVPRLAGSVLDDVLTPPDGGAWKLGIPEPGSVENVTMMPVPDPGLPLGSGQVRVAMRAASLNFRDVLIALGMYPGEAPIGSEGAGVVTEVAPDVTGLAPGDAVMGLFPAGVGPDARTDQRLLVPVPKGWSFAEAATAPVVFATAYYGMTRLAGIRPGQSMLVHAATGGTGMAALQLAKRLGVEVYATASPPKWDTLRALGIDEDHIASSRTADFEEQFRRVSGGRGVDMVLNSLAGPLTDASLRLLAPGGTFVELGKTDVRAPEGVRYKVLDFEAADAGPDLVQQLLHELAALFEAGELRSLPVTAFDVRHARQALRYLSQARHTGKLALMFPRLLDPEGTVLITGGTGALGALAARHLITAHGARHLLLASRSGPDAPGAAELRDELAELGATVTTASCDVTDPVQIDGLLAAIPPGRPLTAVIHAAGVIDDATLPALTRERLAGVLRPKVDAAWHLHLATEHLDLAAFVLYSSVAGVLGSPGQASYAAANVFLDALAAERHRRGIPALSLDWGYWAQASGITGGVTDTDLARMARSGSVPLTTDHALSLLDSALEAGYPCLIAAGMNSASLRDQASAGTLPPVFSGLVRVRTPAAAPVTAAGPVSDGGAGLRERLAALPSDDERRAVLLGVVAEHAATALGYTSADSLDTDLPFTNLGFDSLSAVELRNRLAAATGLRLPATLMFDLGTPDALAEHLRAELA